jgi:hypothetical protein
MSVRFRRSARLSIVAGAIVGWACGNISSSPEARGNGASCSDNGPYCRQGLLCIAEVCTEPTNPPGMMPPACTGTCQRVADRAKTMRVAPRSCATRGIGHSPEGVPPTRSTSSSAAALTNARSSLRGFVRRAITANVAHHRAARVARRSTLARMRSTLRLATPPRMQTRQTRTPRSTNSVGAAGHVSRGES